MRRRAVGYVFQDSNLLPGLTALENVSLPLELDGVSARAAAVSARGALEELDVVERANRYPDELSGGERQRVAIARRSWAAGRCSSQTSRRGRSTRSTPRRSCACCGRQPTTVWQAWS